MKKVYGFLAAALALTLGACQQEKLESSQSDATVKVVVSLDEQTRSFTDAEGLKWEVGNQIKWSDEFVSQPLEAGDIKDGGYTAEFTFDSGLTSTARTGWFCSTNNHPDNYNEVRFTQGVDNGNVYSQTAAGVMNPNYIFLHSGTGLMSIEQDSAPNVIMTVSGTVFRIIPYTSTYNNEKVMAVKLASNTNLVGTVQYDRAAGTYKGVNDINWKQYNSVAVTLDTPFELTGVTSAAASKGIYMAVAATTEALPLDGYRYVVETDKATYTFDAMDKKLAVGEGVVKNVMLDLDKAVRAYESGELQYIGDLGQAQNTVLSADGATDSEGGYWYAQVKQDGATDWATRDGADNVAFYSGVTFECKDKVTGEPVRWLSIKYGGNGGTHWLLSAQANPGEARTAVVTATFPDVKGYKVIDACKTKVIEVTQAAAGSAKTVGYGSTSLGSEITLGSAQATNKDVGYCLLTVDGAEYRDWAGIYSKVRFVCVSEEDAANGKYDNPVSWLSCKYATNDGGVYDCVWWVSVESNEQSESARTAVIVALFPEDDAYVFPEAKQFKVTQKAGVDYTVYDPTSTDNLWLAANFTMGYYYAHTDQWTQLPDPEMVSDGNSYKITLPTATSHQWQAQIRFSTDMTSSASKNYDFYCVLNSNQDINNVTIKLMQTDDIFYIIDMIDLTAGADYVYKISDMAGRDMTAIALLFDFGGNPANSVITIKDILFQEHKTSK